MLRRLTHRPRSALRSFLRQESAGGLLLIGAAVLAMIVANSSISVAYFHTLHLQTGPVLAPKLGPMTLELWINDGLMSVFFLLVGLEIKREFLNGHLSDPADRRLPFIAAAAGMAVPAVIFLLVVRDHPHLARGWAVPAATDIAFALGLLALLGKRAPTSLKLFLTTVAIVDDVGAVAIIALFYTTSLNMDAIMVCAVILVALFSFNRLGMKRPLWYFLGFLLLWYFMLLSGIHATVAGVLAATTVPLKNTPGTPDDKDSTLHRLEHVLQPWVAYLIVPLFGLANAGVALGGASVTAPLSIAIALGLFVGKQAGVFGSVWIAVKVGFAKRPAKTSWAQIYGTSLVCGIGFTMSLFIGALAFPTQPFGDEVKIGVLLGSLLSAAAGFAVLRLAPRASALRPIASKSP